MTIPKNRNIRMKPIHAAGDFLRFGSGGILAVAIATVENN